MCIRTHLLNLSYLFQFKIFLNCRLTYLSTPKGMMAFTRPYFCVSFYYSAWYIFLFMWVSQPWQKKLNFAVEQAMKAQRGSRGIAVLFLLTSSVDWSGWLTPRPGRVTPGKKTRYPLYRRLGGLQSPSGRARKNFSPPGFDLWTVQPVSKHYTAYALLFLTLM